MPFYQGDENDSRKILADGDIVLRSWCEAEFFRNRRRHLVKVRFIAAKTVDVFGFVGGQSGDDQRRDRRARLRLANTAKGR